MKNIFCAMFLMACLFCCNSVFAEEEDAYIVKFKADTVFTCSADLNPLPYSDGIYTVDAAVANELQNDDNVECIIPNYDVELFDAPDDTYFSEQWALTEWGYEDVYERDVTGDGIRIGIIDSGVYSEHPDLAGNISADSYNIISQDDDVSDEYGHGTSVFGIIGALTDNQTGIAGIAPDAEIIMIKCFDGKTTKVSYVISALNYAAELNLDIVNLSFGVSFSSTSENLTLMKEAIDNLADSGAIIVAAVGNNNNSTLYYPAAFDNVIGVGAVNETFGISEHSQYNESVFVTAPGDGIYAICLPDANDGNLYKSVNGTSFSSPYVAAVVALAKSCNTNLTFDEICELIKASSKDLGDTGYDYYYGRGVLNPKVMIDNILGGTKVYISQPECTSLDGGLEFNQKTINGSGNDAKLIYGIFKDGNLVDVKECEFGDETAFEIDYTIDNSYEIKCFTWESFNTILPLYQCRYIEDLS